MSRADDPTYGQRPSHPGPAAGQPGQPQGAYGHYPEGIDPATGQPLGYPRTQPQAPPFGHAHHPVPHAGQSYGDPIPPSAPAPYPGYDEVPASGHPEASDQQYAGAAVPQAPRHESPFANPSSQPTGGLDSIDRGFSSQPSEPTFGGSDADPAPRHAVPPSGALYADERTGGSPYEAPTAGEPLEYFHPAAERPYVEPRFGQPDAVPRSDVPPSDPFREPYGHTDLAVPPSAPVPPQPPRPAFTAPVPPTAPSGFAQVPPSQGVGPAYGTDDYTTAPHAVQHPAGDWGAVDRGVGPAAGYGDPQDPQFGSQPAHHGSPIYAEATGFDAPHPENQFRGDGGAFTGGGLERGYAPAHPGDPQGGFSPAPAAYETEASYGGAALADAAMSSEAAPKSRRGLIVVGALIAAVGIGGAAGYIYKFQTSGSRASGDLPVVAADTRPVKVQPADPGGQQFAGQDREVFRRLERDGTASNAAGQGASADPLANVGATLQGLRGGAGTSVDAATQAAVARAEQAARDVGVRRVATRPVSPDGTLGRAPSNGTLVMPGMVVDQGFGTSARQAAPRAARAAITPPPGMTAPSIAGVEAGLAGAVRDAAAPLRPAAPQLDGPALRDVPPAPSRVTRPERVARAAAPAPRTVTPAAAPTPAPTVTPAAVAARPAAPTVTPTAGGYLVQIASRRSRADALASYATFEQRFGALLAGRTPEIREATINGSQWYRLFIGPAVERQSANDLCVQLKASGLESCFVRRF